MTWAGDFGCRGFGMGVKRAGGRALEVLNPALYNGLTGATDKMHNTFQTRSLQAIPA